MESLSVSEVVHSIKYKLETQFKNIVVQGEISNLTKSSAGHWYFTLSDKDSSLSIACFKFDAMRNPLLRQLKDGDKILCQGAISVYAKRGSFQLLAKRISKIGKGDLKAQFERLKRKLQEEGLFDMELKKEVPMFPQKIAVISAPQGAAIQDFLNIYKRRAFLMNILLIPSLMQGDTAPPSIIKSLSYAESDDSVDLIVITRGGGSIEDLWAFNDEKLVRKIFKCKKPIISAIGHEVDYTLCDYAADLRCETPSAAAETLTQSQMNVQSRLKAHARALGSIAYKQLNYLQKRVSNCHPQRISGLLKENLSDKKIRLSRLNLTAKIDQLLPVREYHQRLDESFFAIESYIQEDLRKKQQRADHAFRMLQGLGPKKVLERGYSYIEQNGNVVDGTQHFDRLPDGELLKVHFHDGVRNVSKNKN